MLLHIFIAAQDSNSQKENIHLRYLDRSKYTEYIPQRQHKDKNVYLYLKNRFYSSGI
jgi:hypothetical protein